VEPGERLPVTACREVREEAGTALTLGRRLTAVRYKANGNPKQVDFWAARATGTDEAAIPNAEVDRVAWLPVGRAVKRASYKQDVAVLKEFGRAPVDTTPLILIRHAKAVARSDWAGDDADRPLDPAGTADAAALASVLECFVPSALILSSPTARCLDTVRPYGERTGVRVRAEERLKASSGTSPAASASLISDLVAAGRPVILCAHRENLPSLLEAALESVSEAKVPDKIAKPLPKGGFLVLHIASGTPGPTLVAIDRYEAELNRHP